MLNYGQQEGKTKLMDLDDLCEYLNVTKSWVYQKTSAKEIPHFKLCGFLRFRKDEIDEWLASKEVKVRGDKGRKRRGGNPVDRYLPRKGVNSKH